MIKKNLVDYSILSRVVGTKFFIPTIVAVALFFGSCDKASVVGLDVQPEDDLLNVERIDSTTIYARTVKSDSLRTDETVITTGDALLGKYVDPLFGTAAAGIYTQLRLPTTNPAFGTHPTVDSVFLCMVYSYGTFYGDTLTQQRVNVYQLTTELKAEEDFYSNSTLAKTYLDLANNYAFYPHPKDSVYGSTTTTREKPQLRIPLNTVFAQAILNNQGTSILANNTNFQSFVKGLYVTTENTILAGDQGAIMHFKMNDSKSRMVIYYHNDTGTYTKKYEFSLTSSPRFNHFKHDYSSSVNDSLAAQMGATPAQANTVVFAQAMAGLKTKITFPHLRNINDLGRVAVNKAELVVKVDTTVSPYSDIKKYATPPTLVLFQINDNGTSGVISPDYFEGTNYFGGSYNASTQTYTFNISRYIQQVLSGQKNNNGIYLLVSNGAVQANRLVLGGGNSSNFKMKLNITYTKLH
jgi:hypothetical protein